MAKIPEETIEQIAAANDIVDVIGGYIPLKRAGSNWRALCPFHQEKSPSFNVNPQRQTYHCFGCGVGGSVFKFVMAYENIDFPSAARKLAERGGIKIVEAEFSAEEDQRSRLRRRLLDLHQQTAGWFHHNLLKTESAKVARDYLKGRGLTAEVAKAWKIGYAPDSWDAFSEWAFSKGFNHAEIVQSGLVSMKDENNPDGDFYDRFRDRLMFPISNAEGEVIAFSGRVLQPEAKSAKYVNSPETPLFVKGNILFGLHKSKRPLIDKGFAIVCEGQIDLISAFEAGVQNVIAPQGTAFTEKQTRILKRYVEEVVLCFDSDNAGQKAAERSLPSLLGENLSVRVAELPAGEDPDSLIRKQGVEAFSTLITGAKDFFDYQIGRAATAPDFATARGKIQFARKIAVWVSLITDSLLRESVSNKVATRMEISLPEFLKLLKQPAKEALTADKSKPVAVEVLEVDSLISSLIHVALTDSEARAHLLEQDWETVLENEPAGDLLAKVLGQNFNPGETAALNAWLTGLPPAEEMAIQRILQQGTLPQPFQTAQDAWQTLKRRQIDRKLDEIRGQLGRTDLSVEKITALQKEFIELGKKRNT